MSHFTKAFVVFLFFLLGTSFFTAGPSLVFASVESFPHYPSLTRNVDFWKKVYTKFPSTKGFVHDSYNLSIIYDVVDLLDNEIPGAREKNRKRIKKAKKKYTRILVNLAEGKQPKTKEEKRVLSLWGAGVSLQKMKNASNNVRFQHCIREKFRQGLERSGRHMNDMRKIFKQKGLPVDLVFLPHVESSFNYNAYSKFGAAGIWQFIRSTGKRFLTINYTVDERRDPILATHAAASYLQENYQKLGSWPLAMTAYNHGANGMLRAQQQCGDFEAVLREYKSRSFGFASRNFYAQFLAAREIAENYQQYFDKITLEKPEKVRTVKLAGYVALDDLVKYLGVGIDDIRSLNPALRLPVYTGQKYIPKGYELKLPLVGNESEAIASIPNDIIKKEQKRSKFYRVGRGDTAGKIAVMHKVKLQDLVTSNNLDRRARIFVGQNLVIPGPRVVGNNIKVASLTQRSSKKRPSLLTMQKKKVVNESLAEIPSKSVDKNNMGEPGLKIVPKMRKKEIKQDVILVQKKDAKKLPDLVVAQEDAREDTTGEVEAAVVITADTLGGITAILGDFQVESIKTDGGDRIGFIHVEAWETLGHYADWLDVDIRRIRNLNKLKFGLPIKTNQKIKIPLTKVDKDLFEERRYEFHKGIEEDFFSAFKVVETQIYKVKRGDTVWGICRKELGLPFWLLKKYNSFITFDELRPNQVLIVPVVEKIG